MKMMAKGCSSVEINVDVSIDFVIKRIRSYVESQGWSRSRLAREAGLPHHTSIRDWDNPDWNPTAAVLRRLEAVVPDDFYLGTSNLGPATFRETSRGARGPRTVSISAPVKHVRLSWHNETAICG